MSVRPRTEFRTCNAVETSGARFGKGGRGEGRTTASKKIKKIKNKLTFFLSLRACALHRQFHSPRRSSCASPPINKDAKQRKPQLQPFPFCACAHISSIRFLLFPISSFLLHSSNIPITLPLSVTRAMRAAQDVRLRAPIDKNPAVDVTGDMHALGKGRRAALTRVPSRSCCPAAAPQPPDFFPSFHFFLSF